MIYALKVNGVQGRATGMNDLLNCALRNDNLDLLWRLWKVCLIDIWKKSNLMKMLWPSTIRIEVTEKNQRITHNGFLRYERRHQ